MAYVDILFIEQQVAVDYVDFYSCSKKILGKHTRTLLLLVKRD